MSANFLFCSVNPTPPIIINQNRHSKRELKTFNQPTNREKIINSFTKHTHTLNIQYFSKLWPTNRRKKNSKHSKKFIILFRLFSYREQGFAYWLKNICQNESTKKKKSFFGSILMTMKNIQWRKVVLCVLCRQAVYHRNCPHWNSDLCFGHTPVIIIIDICQRWRWQLTVHNIDDDDDNDLYLLIIGGGGGFFFLFSLLLQYGRFFDTWTKIKIETIIITTTTSVSLRKIHSVKNLTIFFIHSYFVFSVLRLPIKLSSSELRLFLFFTNQSINYQSIQICWLVFVVCC